MLGQVVERVLLGQIVAGFPAAAGRATAFLLRPSKKTIDLPTAAKVCATSIISRPKALHVAEITASQSNGPQ